MPPLICDGHTAELAKRRFSIHVAQEEFMYGGAFVLSDIGWGAIRE